MKLEMKKKASGYWKQYLVVIRNAQIPWLWVAISFVVNMISSEMFLKLPTLSAGLMSGDLSGAALQKGILFYVLFAVVACSQTAVLAISRCLATRNARSRLWEKMLNIQVKYYDENEPEELLSAVTNDLFVAMPNIVTLLVTVLPDIWFLIRAMFAVGDYDLWLLLSVLGFLPVKYGYMIFMGRMGYKVQLGVCMEIGGLTGFLAERISNLPLIKAFTKEDVEQKKGEEVVGRLLEANMKTYKLDALSEAMKTLITLGQQFVILITAAILLQRGRITMVEWVAFFLFSENIILKVDTLVGDWTFVKTTQGAIARTAELMAAMEEDTTEKAGEDAAYEDGNIVTSCLLGDIEFDHVSFSYGEKQALDDVSFVIPHGSMTAIVGLCGGGKTTSLSLLERFYSPSKGQIRLGGKPIGDMSLGEYRGHFAYVQQNPEVFGGTVREAITYGIRRELSDEEIRRAATASGFSDYLDIQPKGLETRVASGGSSLSGGQLQRLVLAREFLRDADILLFDEPTSALDAKTASAVGQAIQTLFQGKTVLVVTHDLHLLEGMDQILVLENGHLAGDGNYNDLLESCDLFREMIQTQQNGEEVAL